MILPPGLIAAHARAAGFAGNDIVTATACALASSSGDPDYDYRAAMDGAGRWRGLWAVNVDAVTLPDEASFATPEAQAEMACWLRRTTRGFDWCDAYRHGRHERWHDMAAVGWSNELDPGRPLTPIGHVEPARIPATFDRLARLHDSIGRRRRTPRG